MPKLLVGMPKRIMDMPIPGMTQVFWCGNDADTVRVLLGLLCCITHGSVAVFPDGITYRRVTGAHVLCMYDPDTMCITEYR